MPVFKPKRRLNINPASYKVMLIAIKCDNNWSNSGQVDSFKYVGCVVIWNECGTEVVQVKYYLKYAVI